MKKGSNYSLRDVYIFKLKSRAFRAFISDIELIFIVQKVCELVFHRNLFTEILHLKLNQILE